MDRQQEMPFKTMAWSRMVRGALSPHKKASKINGQRRPARAYI
jgi:hypothetical protein